MSASVVSARLRRACMDATAASHLLGQTVRYDLGNVFDPAFTMVCRVAKRWLI